MPAVVEPQDVIGSDARGLRRDRAVPASKPGRTVSVLTGGGDTQYAIPLTVALAQQGLRVEVIGSTEFLTSESFRNSGVTFINVHGNMDSKKPLHHKVLRVLSAYLKLAWYAARTDSKAFHILWHNTFKVFDRIVVTGYYKLLGKTLFFTVHNVDIDVRDGKSGFVSRASLRFMYHMMDHIFVHTAKMKAQLERDFGVPGDRITVHAFGINVLPTDTALTRLEARRKLGIGVDERVALFFGNLAPYKGLEYLVEALGILTRADPRDGFKLVVAGNIKGQEAQPYWKKITDLISEQRLDAAVLPEIRYIPNEEVEVFFKAADVCVLPYVYIYQTGVLFTSYRYGVPAVVTDAGSMAEDVVEGRTGFVCRSSDATDLARALKTFFGSQLFAQRDSTRRDIVSFANSRYSWESIAATISASYQTTCGTSPEL